MEFLKRMQSWMQATSTIDFLGPLALRLYLVPVFWVAGTNKLGSIENVAAWFGNPDWGLGLPAPTLMAYLATYTEVLGAVALLLGLATRWFAIPLMVTMLVAAFKVHETPGFKMNYFALASYQGNGARNQAIVDIALHGRTYSCQALAGHAHRFRSCHRYAWINAFLGISCCDPGKSDNNSQKNPANQGVNCDGITIVHHKFSSYCPGEFVGSI